MKVSCLTHFNSSFLLIAALKNFRNTKMTPNGTFRDWQLSSSLSKNNYCDCENYKITDFCCKFPNYLLSLLLMVI